MMTTDIDDVVWPGNWDSTHKHSDIQKTSS